MNGTDRPVFPSRRIVFTGVARDCGTHLPAVLANLTRWAALFGEVAFVFVENDSRDGTKKIFAEWAAGRPRTRVVHLDGLGKVAARTERIEIARGVCHGVIRSDPAFAGYDYVSVADMDDVNAMPADPAGFRDAVELLQSRPEHAGVFANQQGTYYDMWALRHPTMCPRDVWEEVLSYSLDHRCSDQEAFDRTFGRRIFSLDPGGEPLEVESAFGGAGLYRRRYYVENPNPYLGSVTRVYPRKDKVQVVRMQACEHVHFHQGIRTLGGRLFVLPRWINARTPKLAFPASAFRSLFY